MSYSLSEPLMDSNNDLEGEKPNNLKSDNPQPRSSSNGNGGDYTKQVDDTSPVAESGEGASKAELGCFGRCRTPAQYARMLTRAFPIKFLVFLGIVYFCLKGLAFQAVTAAQLPFYKDELKVGPSDYQRFFNVATMGYALKPLVGAASDVLPIFGYRKKFYAAGFSLMAGVAVVLVSILPKEESSGAPSAALFFVVVWGVAALDLLCEGKYSEMMAKHPDEASSIVTWAWGCYMIGAIVAAAIEGPIADSANVDVVFWVCAPFLMLPVIPAFLGWIPEGRVVNGKELEWEAKPNESAKHPELGNSTEPPAPNDPESPTSNPESSGPVANSNSCCKCDALRYWSGQEKSIVVCGMCNALAAVTLAIISLLTDNRYITLTYIVLVLIALLTACYRFLPRPAFQAQTFFVLHNIFYLNCSGYLDYWYTASPSCVPGGPHFSYSYYQTFGGILGSVSGLVGVFFFEAKLSGWGFRQVYFLSTFLKILASLFDLMLILRWNLSLDIPDKVAFVMGDKIILQVVQMLDFMPGVILMSKVCPKGVEATTYALLAGFSNFGYVVSTSLGYLLAEAMGITHVSNPDGTETCNFDSLPWLVLISHAFLPLLTIPAAIFFLPATSMKKNIDGVNPVDKEHDGITTSLAGARESFADRGEPISVYDTSEADATRESKGVRQSSNRNSAVRASSGKRRGVEREASGGEYSAQELASAE